MTGTPPVVGMWWHQKNHEPDVAFVFAHYAADFSEHYLAGPLANIGYGVLGVGTRYRTFEEFFILDKALDDIEAAMDWLTKNTTAKRIVFVGNSGGGTLLAAYQDRVEKDTTGSARGADAYIFLNAHAGRADVLTGWLDPSVTDENDPLSRDPSLDMYNPANGPPYLPEFQARFREAQRQRNLSITAWVKKELKRLNDAGVSDRTFVVHRTFADLRFLDPTIDPSKRQPKTSYHGDPQKANNGVGMMARASTLSSWLSMWSLEDSPSRWAKLGPGFSLPTLVIQSTEDVGVFPSMAKELHDLNGSKNKELKWIPGSHFFEDGQESLDHLREVIKDWTEKTIADKK